MIVKKHILLSSLAILALFALNFSVNFWNTQQKGNATEYLQQALARQALTTSIKQNITEVRQQVDRLGQIDLHGATIPLPPIEIEKMDLQSAAIGAQITKLRKLSDSETRVQIEDLQESYADLTASWHVFYANFGTNHVQALTELALHIEPLTEYVLHETMPLLDALENRQIESAQQQLKNAEWLDSDATLMIFIFLLSIAIALAAQVYYRMAHGLDMLQQGVQSIRDGKTGHRIELSSDDELGAVANTLNNLSESLREAHIQRNSIEQELAQCSVEIEEQRQTAKSLLLNILPATVAEEFRLKGSVAPKYLEDVTIVFTDFVGFSSSAETLAADDLVQMLHEYFSTFDEIAARYGLEKLKTIGDSYMCAGGLPERNPSHPVDSVMAAMEIVRAVTEYSAKHRHSLAVRVGIHTGHVIAGMVGKQKFSYDIWGESVNYASRVESSSEPNQIALSGQTYLRVKDFFECEKHNKTNAKVAQNMDLHFVQGFLPSLIDDYKKSPPAAFVRRYNSYFQKDPPSFPPLQPKYLAGNVLKIQGKTTQ